MRRQHRRRPEPARAGGGLSRRHHVRHARSVLQHPRAAGVSEKAVLRGRTGGRRGRAADARQSRRVHALHQQRNHGLSHLRRRQAAPRRLRGLRQGDRREDDRAGRRPRAARASTACIGVGELAKATRAHQMFFINGRSVRCALLSKALEQVCRSRVTIGMYPDVRPQPRCCRPTPST